jgi:hypothetical protein
MQPDIVAVERYDSGGAIGKDGQQTIFNEGYIVLRLEEAGLTVVRQKNQLRLQCLEAAKVWLPRHAERHMADALAHAEVRQKKEGWT